MSRIRQQNVFAAQWSANGGALGAPDLTAADNQVSAPTSSAPPSSASGCPRTSSEGAAQTIARGEALDTALADAVAAAMKDWAMEKGATHYTHWFQPMTGLTAEKHDSFSAPPARARRSPSSPARS